MKLGSSREIPAFNDEKLMVDLIMLSGANPKLTPMVNRLLKVIQEKWINNPPQSLLDMKEQELLDYFQYVMGVVHLNTELAVKQKKSGRKVTVISTIPALEQQLLGKFVLYALYLKGEFKEEYQFNPVTVEAEIIRASRSVHMQILINIFRTMDKARPQKDDYFTESREVAQLAAGVLHSNIQWAEEHNSEIKLLEEGKIMKGMERVMQLAKIIRDGHPDDFYKVMDVMFKSQGSYLIDMNLLVVRQALMQLDETNRERFVQMLVGLANYPVTAEAWLKINDYWHDLFSPMQWGKINQGTKLRVISESGLVADGHSLSDGDLDEGKIEGTGDMIDQLNELATQVDGKITEEKVLREFAQTIMRERSSGMSQDGHRLPLKTEDSPLAEMIEEVRINRNKETGKPAIGIACNVNFRLKDGHIFYAKLTAQGELLIRAMDSNGKELRVLKKGEEPRLSNKLIDEFNRIALEKLKVIYVRQKPTIVKALPEKNVLIEVEAVNDVENELQKIAADSSEQIAKIIETAGQNGGETAVNSEQLVFPEMVEQGWTQQGKETPMKIDLTEKEKVLRAKISKKERIKIESNMSRVKEFFTDLKAKMTPVKPMSQTELWPAWPALDEELTMRLKNLFLHVLVKMDGDEYYEVIDAEKAYEQLREGKLTIGQLFVRSKRAYTQALPYMQSQKRIADECLENERLIWMIEAKEMSEQAKLKMEIFQSGEQGEEMNLDDKSKILYFSVEDKGETSLQSKIFENVQSGRASFLMGLGKEKEIRECHAEMKARAAEKYLLNGQAGRYGKVVARLDQVLERKLKRSQESLEEIRLMAKSEVTEVLRNDGGTRKKTTLFLPANGFKFGQTFNQGAFKSVAELLGNK